MAHGTWYLVLDTWKGSEFCVDCSVLAVVSFVFEANIYSSCG